MNISKLFIRAFNDFIFVKKGNCPIICIISFKGKNSSLSNVYKKLKKLFITSSSELLKLSINKLKLTFLVTSKYSWAFPFKLLKNV